MATDYERNPTPGDGETNETLSKWNERRKEAEEDRKQYLPQIKINRKFAASKQHLNVNTKDGRVLDVRERHGIKLVTSDILTPYMQTAVGRMTANDYRPNFLVSQDNEVAEDVAEQINAAFGWGWDNEWQADKKIIQLWRLLAVDGTAALRCRYDRKFGEVVGDVPYKDGKPILDETEARSHMATEYAAKRPVKLGTLREGRVVWEILTAENLLPPPGFDSPDDFPWEIVVRPVLISDLKDRYGAKAEGLEPEEIDSSGSLTAGLGYTDQKQVKLQGRVLVYTGYERPCAEYKNGRVVVFTKDRVLDERDHLPYSDHPRGPQTGLHYFRWQVIPGRFFARAFIEGGIGPQQVRNKRLTQIDAIIDRNLPRVFIEEQSVSRPKSGEPMEVVEVRPGAPLPKVEQGVPPGAWMLQDVKLQEENAEKALGLSPVSRGQPPPGVSAYSAMALLNENNSLQFDPIAQDFRLEMVEVGWDTMEAMRNWPSNKQIQIAGPENALQVFEFNSSMIPPRYMVRPPRGGTLPRTQAAELQKINDIWRAAAESGKPLSLDWYISSLNAGKAQDLPPSLGDQQAHKAELENIAMQSTLTSPPVAEYDDDAKHVEIHRAYQIQFKVMADQGDELAEHVHTVIEQHIQDHLLAAQGEAMSGGQPPGMAMIGNPQQGYRPPTQTGGLPSATTIPPVTSGPSEPTVGQG